ncbi:MAG: hypothetical protein WC635_06745 [Bacteriovorax sp.]|jgi:hypothetical protein
MQKFAFFSEKKLKQNLYYVFLFIAFSIIVFFPTIFGDPFWDDWVFIFKRATDLREASSPFIFFQPGSANKTWPVFYAATWLMLKAFKDHYIYYHLVSLTLHGINGFLCWHLLRKLKIKHGFWLALLYVVHPLHLFTVAWIIQIKTILSLFFFFISLINLVNYFEKFKNLSLLWAVLFFTLSILTKSTTVTFAACLVLIYPLLSDKKKYRKFILYFLTPVIILASISTVRTLWNFNLKEYLAKEETVGNTYSQMSNIDRLVISSKNFLRYSSFIVLPTTGNHLFQENTILSYSSFEFFWVITGLILFYFLFDYLYRNKLQIEMFGLIFYIVTIIPFCGIVYIPMLAISNFVPYWLSIPFIGLLPLFSRAVKSKKILVTVVATFTIVSHIQAYSFIQTEEIFLDSIQRSPLEKGYQISLVEHYIFTHQCEKAMVAYELYFKESVPFSDGLLNKLKRC